MVDDKRDSSLDLLRDEYKILQDKIDKIGAFRFTIRGWSVTAVIGGFLAGSGVKTLPLPLISISVTVSLAFFLLFEKEQLLLSRRFGVRAKQIEDAIRSNQGQNFVGPLITQVSGTAKNKGVSWYAPLLSLALRRTMLKLSKAVATWSEASAAFYLFLIFLSFSPELLPVARMISHWLVTSLTAVKHMIGY